MQSSPSTSSAPQPHGSIPPEPSTRFVVDADGSSGIIIFKPSHINTGPLTTVHESVDIPNDLKSNPGSIDIPSADATPSPDHNPTAADVIFQQGADALGPEAAVLQDRAVVAESALGPKTLAVINKGEEQDAKKLSKVLTAEGKADKKVIKAALKDLSKAQALARKASKDEASAVAAHSKALQKQHKLRLKFLDSQARYEYSATDVKNKANAIESVKSHATRQVEALQEKTREVERLRARTATEDRERQAKISALVRAANI